jgi:hypothetical protein
LNKAVLSEKRHIPSLPELTRRLNGKKWFSKLDFKEAFNQCKFDEQSRLYCAMSTIYGTYIWNRLSMGLSTAAELFQECMMRLLGDIEGTQCCLDDVLLATETEEQAIICLKKCLDRIESSGMTLNYEKCVFIKPSVTFFGMTISADGIKPRQSTLQDLLDAEAPQTKPELHSFLGLSGYFKNRTPFQSSVDKPLRNLLKKNAKFAWEQEQQKAFETLKNSVIQDNLAHFDCRLETEL